MKLPLKKATNFETLLAQKQCDSHWFRHLRKDNTYFRFIRLCRAVGAARCRNHGQRVHVHHIIPKYLLRDTDAERAYCDSAENLITLSPEDHRYAHVLFQYYYPDHRNLGAVALLTGSMSVAARAWKQAGAYASHRAQRKARGAVFSVSHQKMAAARSLARPNARASRRAGGLVGGRNRQANRVVTANDRYLWFYRGEPMLCTFNCVTGQDIVRDLVRAVPSTLARISPVLNGSRKQSHGWSCLRVLPTAT